MTDNNKIGEKFRSRTSYFMRLRSVRPCVYQAKTGLMVKMENDDGICGLVGFSGRERGRR